MDINIASSPDEKGWNLDVRISDSSSYSDHLVTVSEDTFDRLTEGRCTPTELVRCSFAFLLKREPKEAILRQCNITVISCYFPKYEAKMREWLGD